MTKRCPAWLAVALALPAAAAVPPPPVANALRPGSGEVPAFALRANGVQVYHCSPLPSDPNVFTWVLTAPEATLYDGNRSVASWTSPNEFDALNDRSSVSAIVRTMQSASRDDMPWALLHAIPAGDSGIFSGVTSIQRVNTQGGAPPPSGCDVDHVGEEARSPFTADLYFYKPANVG